MSKSSNQKIGRLAMRREGNQWVAYYAMPETMKGALRLASVQIALVQRQDRKDAFMGIMRDMVADIIEANCGVRPTWPEGAQPAPEHERSGRA